MHALVIGGTGILRPLTDALVGRGWTVTVVAREASEEGPGRFVVPVDAAEPEALAAALDEAITARGTLDLCVVYAPFAPAESMRGVAARSVGRLLYAVTSEWAAPGTDGRELYAWAPEGAGSTQRVVLGWTRGEDGSTRWHTPEEISAGVLAALDSGEGEVTIGRLRPWEEQPD